MIETERLILRGPRETDKAAIRQQLSNFAIARMLAKVPHPYPPGHENVWWERVQERKHLGLPPYFMLTSKEAADDLSIGAIAIGPKGTAVTKDAPWRMGYWLDEPWWGKGLMGEATARVLTHAFETREPQRVFAGVYEGNEASLRILEGHGFTYVDTSDEWCEARGKSLPHINLVKENPSAS